MFTRKSVVLLIAFCLLLSGVAYSQIDTNVIGLTEGDGWYDDWCVECPGSLVYTLAIYLQYPINPDFGDGATTSVQNVGGFECNLSATMGATILDVRFPVPAINVGNGANIIVGFGEPVPVIDGYAILAEFDVLLIPFDGDPSPGVKSSPVGCDSPDGALWLAPSYPASIEGFLAYLDFDDPDDALVSAVRPYFWDDSPSMFMQVFGVPVETETWGSVKAIYR